VLFGVNVHQMGEYHRENKTFNQVSLYKRFVSVFGACMELGCNHKGWIRGQWEEKGRRKSRGRKRGLHLAINKR